MQNDDYEKWITVQRAVIITGFAVWKIYGAINTGLIPCKTFFNSRKHVRVSDIERAMSSINGTDDNNGGDNE